MHLASNSDSVVDHHRVVACTEEVDGDKPTVLVTPSTWLDSYEELRCHDAECVRLYELASLLYPLGIRKLVDQKTETGFVQVLSGNGTVGCVGHSGNSSEDSVNTTHLK